MNGVTFVLNLTQKAKNSSLIGRTVTIKANYGDRFPKRLIPFMVNQVLHKFKSAIFITKDDDQFDIIKELQNNNTIVEVQLASMEGISVVLARMLLADRVEISDPSGEFCDVHLPVDMLDQLRDSFYKELDKHSEEKEPEEKQKDKEVKDSSVDVVKKE